MHVCRGGLCVLERIIAVFKWTHYHQREHKHSSRKTSVPEPRRCLFLAFRGTEAEQQTTKKDRHTSSWISHSAQSPQQTSALFPFLEQTALPVAFKHDQRSLFFPCNSVHIRVLRKDQPISELNAAGNPRCVLEPRPLDISHHLPVNQCCNSS